MVSDVDAALWWLRFIHTVIFAVAALAIVTTPISALRGRVTGWTWAGVGYTAVIGVALALNGCVCPLQTLARHIAGVDHWISDIFLPEWMANAIVPVCTPIAFAGYALVLWRVIQSRTASS